MSKTSFNTVCKCFLYGKQNSLFVVKVLNSLKGEEQYEKILLKVNQLNKLRTIPEKAEIQYKIYKKIIKELRIFAKVRNELW